MAADSNMIVPSPSSNAGTRPSGCRARCSGELRSSEATRLDSNGAPISFSAHKTRVDRVRGTMYTRDMNLTHRPRTADPAARREGDARRVVEQREYVVPVVGAGISVPAGLP